MFTWTVACYFKTYPDLGPTMLDIGSVLEEVLRGVDRERVGGTHISAQVQRLSTGLMQLAAANPLALAPAVQAGFEDACRQLDNVSVAVTGLAWLGGGVPSVEQEMKSLIAQCRRELALCAYSITSGALPLLANVREVVSQGVSATLIVNRWEAQPVDVRQLLLELARSYPRHFRLLEFVAADPRAELHAKILVVDRSAALIGSANLSFHGMVSNHEMALVVRGPTAELIASRVDMITIGGFARSIGG